MNRLGVEKKKKSHSDLIIETSFELYGFTPNERSDANLKWMLENGYLSRQAQRHRRGTRGRPSNSKRFSRDRTQKTQKTTANHDDNP